MNFITIFQFLQLVIGIVHTVHEVQAAMPGAPGAEKSQAVIDKVTPIASALSANAGAIQSVIDGVVSLGKAVGTIRKGEAAPVLTNEPGTAAQIAP